MTISAARPREKWPAARLSGRSAGGPHEASLRRSATAVSTCRARTTSASGAPAADARADMTAIRPGSVSTGIRVASIQAGSRPASSTSSAPPAVTAGLRRSAAAHRRAAGAGRTRLAGGQRPVRPELGQLPGQAQGVGGACWADLRHVCKTFNIVFSAAATLFGSARLRDGEIEVGVGVGFVFEGVVPPFAVVGIEAAVLHDGAEVVPVFRFG